MSRSRAGSEIDEMCVPGGLPWYEPEAFPALADWECGACGLIGHHEPGCPNGLLADLYEKENEMSDVTCKVDGCERPYAQQFGKYGGLCEEHAAEKKHTNGNGQAEMVDDLRPKVPVMVIDGDGVRPGVLTDDGHGDVVQIGEPGLVEAARKVVEARVALDAARERLAYEVELLQELLRLVERETEVAA